RVSVAASSTVGFVSLVLFFFSSRRRHTRSKRDWSSDVCSSDLAAEHQREGRHGQTGPVGVVVRKGHDLGLGHLGVRGLLLHRQRSEERRVGKGGGARGGRSK